MLRMLGHCGAERRANANRTCAPSPSDINTYVRIRIHPAMTVYYLFIYCAFTLSLSLVSACREEATHSSVVEMHFSSAPIEASLAPYVLDLRNAMFMP